VGGAEEVVEVAAARGVEARQVPHHREDAGLVEDRPLFHAVAEGPYAGLGVIGESRGGVPLGPAAAVLERLRQVPVVEGGEGADPGRQQRVDQPGVVVRALGIDRARSIREQAGPGDGEAIAVEVHLAQQRHVFGDPVVGIAGHVAGMAVPDPSRGVGEAVPDGLALSVLPPGSLDLVGGGRSSPAEAVRKRHPTHAGSSRVTRSMKRARRRLAGDHHTGPGEAMLVALGAGR
jgi:hypothetical protein